MLTLIIGVPNAGKTTFSKNFKNVLHADEIRPTKEVPFMKAVCNAVSEADAICVEGLFMTARHRRPVVEAYKGNDEKVCVWLNYPLEECIAREDRGRKEALVRDSHMVFEPPTYEEGWDRIVIITGDEMTKIMLRISENRHDIYFDCLNHAGDHDVCTIISTLCNVLVAECIRLGSKPSVYEEGHVHIDIEYATPQTVEVFKAVEMVFKEIEKNHPDIVKIY